MYCKEIKLGDALKKIVGGGTPSKKNKLYWGGKIPWASVKDMPLENHILFYTKDNITEKGLQNSSTNLIEANTVIISTRMGLGRAFINEVDMAINQDLKALFPKNILDKKYLLWFMLSQAKLLESLGSGTTVSGIRLNQLKNLKVKLYPINTQKKIASILSNYDDLIRTNFYLIKILEKISKNLYQEWFVNFRFPGHKNIKKKDSELGQIPKNFEIKTFFDLVDVSWGDTNVTKSSYVEEGYPAYSASGLDGKLSYYDYDRDAIVLSAIGANCGLTWFASGKWSCIKNTIRFFSKVDKLSNEYLFYYSYGKNFWPKRGSAQPFISQKDIEKISIIVPPKKLLDEFSSQIKSNLKLLNNLMNQNNYLKIIRSLLLHKLFSKENNISNLDIKKNNKVA